MKLAIPPPPKRDREEIGRRESGKVWAVRRLGSVEAGRKRGEGGRQRRWERRETQRGRIGKEGREKEWGEREVGGWKWWKREEKAEEERM